MVNLIAAKPNQILAIDFTVLEPFQNVMENVSVIIVVFSTFTQVVSTQDLQASTVSKVIIREWYGLSGQIYLDQGK